MSDKFYFARFLFEIAHVRDNTVLYLRDEDEGRTDGFTIRVLVLGSYYRDLGLGLLMGARLRKFITNFESEGSKNKRTETERKSVHQQKVMMNATKVFLTSTRNKIKFCRCYCVYNKNYSVRSNRLERRRQQQLISKILRVDHAGEVGADRIYAGQLAVLRETSYGPVIQVCNDQFWGCNTNRFFPCFLF